MQFYVMRLSVQERREKEREFSLFERKNRLGQDAKRILLLRSHHAPGADPRYIRQNITFEVPAGLCRS